MTDQLTPEQIEQLQFWRAASRTGSSLCTATTIALDLLAQVEQQPEPVSRDELTHQLRLRHASGFSQVAKELLSRYTITRKQPEGTDHGE